MPSAEFYTVLSQIYLSPLSPTHIETSPDTVIADKIETVLGNEEVDNNRGRIFTSQGPPEYKGKGILEDPELLWLDDAEWDEERIQEAETRIKIQGEKAPQFWRDKYVREASKYWHIFYKRNTDHFYKDRHYLHVVFPELLNQPEVDSLDGRVRLLEVGCGVGNAILPLVDLNPSLTIHAIDFAASAIQILRSNPVLINSNGNLLADVCDIVNDEIPVRAGTQDLVLCMFVLSAIEPMAQAGAITKLMNTLKPGGKLLIRDYGRYDEAQLRFKKGSKLDDNFYVRQDGTCAYYFDISELQAICGAGRDGPSGTEYLDMEQGEYILRQYANRQQKVARHRVWIQAKFVKKLVD